MQGHSYFPLFISKYRPLHPPGLNAIPRQSRLSDLVTGKWKKFSLEMMLTLVKKAGMNVKLKIAV